MLINWQSFSQDVLDRVMHSSVFHGFIKIIDNDFCCNLEVLWPGGRREKGCPACVSETVRCRKLLLGRDIS